MQKQIGKKKSKENSQVIGTVIPDTSNDKEKPMETIIVSTIRKTSPPTDESFLARVQDLIANRSGEVLKAIADRKDKRDWAYSSTFHEKIMSVEPGDINRLVNLGILSDAGLNVDDENNHWVFTSDIVTLLHDEIPAKRKRLN